MENPRERSDDGSACGMQATPIRSGTDEAEGQYGLWMVVTRKRLGQKGTKTGTSLEGTTRSAQNSTHPLMSDDVGRVATSSNGPPLGPFTVLGSLRPTGLAQEGQAKNPFNLGYYPKPHWPQRTKLEPLLRV